ncbi:S8 family serine peptidase [Cyclobacterium plantarum]|uniref:S8 family serine peptidase n=1 Tax=Cyclobacterium plantarum TaxID=2716263 RepID=UPI003F728931
MKNFPKSLTTASRQEAYLDSKRLLLTFKKQMKQKEIASVLKKTNLLLEEAPEKRKEHDAGDWNKINHTGMRFWVKNASGENFTDADFSGIQRNLSDILDWIGPVYSLERNDDVAARFCPLPNVLLIEKTDKYRDRQDEIIKNHQLNEVAEKSRYLSRFRYLRLKDTRETNVYRIREELQQYKEILGTIRYETMPMIKPFAPTIPNDTLWANQWNMTQINATNAWDISTGDSSVVICILDEGCDLTHPDLQFSEDGINLGTMLPTGAPTGNHGTACAGIAAATFNNNEGVAGLAGNCLIMPLAFDTWSDVEVASGINYASSNGASVISMSFGWNPWDPNIIDPEIQNAFDNDLVMCVATHNHDSTITYPATNPLVMACGASSTDDNRKSPTSPDGENWGSNFGDLIYNGTTTGVSVVAPGVQIPTTDIQGGGGYDPGDYAMAFNGTSSATPLVAGLAGLIRSQYPHLTNVEVRNAIERTAAKVGTLLFGEVAGFDNGSRNEEMGYGRIDAFQALDFSDVMIKDWSGDDGSEPSTPPSNNFWSYSDIVVRINDDDVFNPNDPAQSKNVERGQANFIYVQVTNNGPNEARNVEVDFRITPYVGLQFVFPDDWTLEDAMHVSPTPVAASFPSIAAGASVIAKFTISADQTDTLYGWQYLNPWHPCLLAIVTSDNDYPFISSDLSFGNLVLRKNNIAQRNLSVIDVLANATASRVIFSPFIAGNRANQETRMFIEVDRTKLPSATKVYLSLDDDEEAFPMVDFHDHGFINPGKENGEGCRCQHDEMVFLTKTIIKTKQGCCEKTITLEKGSTLSYTCRKEKAKVIQVRGGNLVVENGSRFIEITGKKLTAEFEKDPGQLVPMSVKVEFSPQLKEGDSFPLTIIQRDSKRQIVGGADTVYRVVKEG